MFTYIRHKTPIGVKVEEVAGGIGYSPRAWRMLAGQVWNENGAAGYRAIDHYPDGAPYSESDERISVTHTDHVLLVATLPRTPEEKDLSQFSARAALGIDAERCDREQVLKVRDKFLSNAEQQMLPADNVEQNILAWTIKEAVYKAMLTPGLPLVDGIEIKKLPQLQPENSESIATSALGEAVSGDVTFLLYSYRLDSLIVTLAITPATSTYRKSLL